MKAENHPYAYPASAFMSQIFLALPETIKD
jgi:hypothetical protein